MSNLDFESEFLNTNFDSLLTTKKNPLINSHDQFIEYKQNYLAKTYKNFSTFNSLKQQLESISQPSQQVAPTKYVHVVIDPQQEQQITQDIIELVRTQRVLYENFIHYINHLNENSEAILADNKPAYAQSVRSRKGSRRFLRKIN